jgi:hypothetical protein
MKSNIVLFWILTVYLLAVAGIYALWNSLSGHAFDWPVTTLIAVSAGLTSFIAIYLMLVQKKQGGVLIEDREDSDIDDGDPELGEFSPWSWWPIFLAFGASVVVLGLCVGFNFWLSLIDKPLLLVGEVGWVYEYNRGNFAR